ncbi:MFS transporter [Saccharopolyspora mangrovi]|uniref:MFS transporter n=1 Tax=Saccharopolyspora mangrovi TaxID=3082379 RepID=A0ABU6AJM2_9PSEU|nr:MFS transporter [Saccharopolyspora sp. S2-29]MEB3371725.1 MFS transporter [Saccharopolyspora sp. S2-29]
MASNTVLASPVPSRARTTGLVVMLAIANLGLWLAVYAPALVTISIRIREVRPDDAVTVYGTVTAAGAVFALLGNPLFGRLSDRSRSRFGRRRPYFVGGMLAGTAAVGLVGIAESVPAIMAAWCAAQLAYNAAMAALMAVLADYVPPQQRGRVAGVTGVCNYAALAGSAYVAGFFASSTLLMFLAPALIGLVLVCAFAPVLREPANTGTREPIGVRDFLMTFWVNPVKNPDFAWAWLSRFFICLAWMTLLTYQSFLLINRFGFSNYTVADAVSLASLVLVAGILVGSAGGGYLSDRTGRRKIFIVVAALLAAVGFPAIAFAYDLSTFHIGVAVVGLGIGVHMAVDLALVTELLPDQSDAGKDLGVFNIANVLPQSVAPAFAAVLFATLGGQNFTALYLFAAAFAVVGAVPIAFIRRSR